ncbi:type II toxin-antitoxin system Phd/YefM family antitoxin [Actinomadura rubrisoli]|uniref:Antitoxin n=1 Tax=Actinomadura rubrisoli TaxID=2530368 RepID=A0A4R5A1P9_9ACTN|nr:type II toxin-antitoxin system Phd/YefM family antitoxin [Actinomadura rubrisoli]TDD64429.1 type II toxin-antitoxin system Phd/YefM family antitoxin [Actinomadura rubrisoli]
MEDVPLKLARQRLGKLHSDAIHGRHIKITRHGSDAAVLVPETDYQEYQALKREKIQAAVVAEIQHIAPYVENGELPPGYEALTREQAVEGERFA